MAERYKGIYSTFSMLQIALLRAQYITDMNEEEGQNKEHAAKVFDVCLEAGLHPTEETRAALLDELDWSKVEAEENSTDLGGQDAND